MSFWTDAIQNMKDPKRNFRFKVSFSDSAFAGTGAGQTGAGNGSTSGIPGIWYAKKVQQPSVTISESSHDFMIHKFYWPAKVEWNEIEMTLVDPVLPDVQTQFLSAIEAAGFVIPGGNNVYKSVSKSSAALKLGNVKIEQLDADGAAIGAWRLQHAWAKEVSFSDLDYSSEDLMEITLKLRYDWAEYTPASGAVIFQPKAGS